VVAAPTVGHRQRSSPARPAPRAEGARYRAAGEYLPPGDVRRRRVRHRCHTAHSERLEPAALVYGFTLTVAAVFYSLLWFYAMGRRRLLRDDADPKVVSGITRSFLPGPWIYLASTLVAFWKPTVSIVLYAAIAVFYMLESAVFGRRKTAAE